MGVMEFTLPPLWMVDLFSYLRHQQREGRILMTRYARGTAIQSSGVTPLSLLSRAKSALAARRCSNA
jgi:hypothetical protein